MRLYEARVHRALHVIKSIAASRAVYNLCIDRHKCYAGPLYKRYSETITNYLQRRVYPLVQPLHGANLLTTLKQQWDNYSVMHSWLEKFFHYLDRFYVQMEKVPTLHDKAIEIFKATIYEPMKKAVTQALIFTINKSREGELIDETLVKCIIGIYKDMGTKKKKPLEYEADFEVRASPLFHRAST